MKGLLGKVVLLVSMSHATAVYSIGVGDAFPEVTIASAAGKTAALAPSALKGKVTMINFWATWCEACKIELVEMADVLKDVAAKPTMQLAFVSLDKDPAAALSYLKSSLKSGDFIQQYLYFDSKFAAANELDIDAFPMTLIVGKDGRIAYVQKGFEAGKGHTEKLREVMLSLEKDAS